MSGTEPLPTQIPPVVDIKFCSNLRITFTVRKILPEPFKVGGVGRIEIEELGGGKKFTFEGSALKDSGGNLILTVKPPKEGIMANLSGQKQWKALKYLPGKDDPELLFTLKYSGPKNIIEVSLTDSKRCDYKIEKGSLEKDFFTISVMSGADPPIAAKVNRNYFFRDDNEEMKINSTYDVEVEPGYDQAFIFGLVAVLEQLPH